MKAFLHAVETGETGGMARKRSKGQSLRGSASDRAKLSPPQIIKDLRQRRVADEMEKVVKDFNEALDRWIKAGRPNSKVDIFDLLFGPDDIPG